MPVNLFTNPASRLNIIEHRNDNYLPTQRSQLNSQPQSQPFLRAESNREADLDYFGEH